VLRLEIGDPLTRVAENGGKNDLAPVLFWREGRLAFPEIKNYHTAADERILDQSGRKLTPEEPNCVFEVKGVKR
jgi:hypothetical protein